MFRKPDDVVSLTNDHGSPLEDDPAEEGVGWFFDREPDGSGTWIAVSTYPDNLQIVWWAEQRVLGELWHRLDDTLLELAGADETSADERT